MKEEEGLFSCGPHKPGEPPILPPVLCPVYQLSGSKILSDRTKSATDIRDDKQFLVDHPDVVPITTAQGEELRKLINAPAYIECRSKTQQLPIMETAAQRSPFYGSSDFFDFYL